MLQVLKLLIGAWGLALFLVGLSEVHQLDGKRILLAVFLPLFVLGVIAAVAAAIIVATAPVPPRRSRARRGRSAGPSPRR